MITKTVSSALKEISPPVAVTSAAFMGVSFQNWVYILTAAYTLVQLLRLLPKIIGCGNCFYKHGTCTLTCKEHKAD